VQDVVRDEVSGGGERAAAGRAAGPRALLGIACGLFVIYFLFLSCFYRIIQFCFLCVRIGGKVERKTRGWIRGLGWHRVWWVAAPTLGLGIGVALAAHSEPLERHVLAQSAADDGAGEAQIVPREQRQLPRRCHSGRGARQGLEYHGRDQGCHNQSTTSEKKK
jgi:hypothetical protein